jgi:hypothetical protein
MVSSPFEFGVTMRHDGGVINHQSEKRRRP